MLRFIFASFLVEFDKILVVNCFRPHGLFLYFKNLKPMSKHTYLLLSLSQFLQGHKVVGIEKTNL